MDRMIGRLLRFDIENHRISFESLAGPTRSFLSLWYPDLDLVALAAKFGPARFERLLAHIVLFEFGKYTSVGVEELDLGPLAKWVDGEVAELWSEACLNIWAQWRYENNYPNRPVPSLSTEPGPLMESTSSTYPLHNERHLALFGGGKDSFIGLRMLEKAGIAFDVLSYTSSVYGTRQNQVDATQFVSGVFPSAQLRSFSICDEFSDAPVIDIYGDELGTSGILAGETPSSLFETIPIILAHGYPQIAAFHERSSGEPNLYWEAEGRPVNHQWGKSPAARRVFGDYLKSRVLGNLHYYSPLEAFSDPAIFCLLAREDWGIVSRLSSCNVRKPWCRRCPKCVYVWLNYLAYLEEGPVRDVFAGEDLFAIPDNWPLLRELAGWTEHTPFECVGQPDDVHSALLLCLSKGLGHGRIEDLLQGVPRHRTIDSLGTKLKLDPEEVALCQLPPALEKYLLSEVANYLQQCYKRLSIELLR